MVFVDYEKVFKLSVGKAVRAAGLGYSGPEFEPLFFTVELTPGGLTQPVILPKLAK